MIHVRQSLRRVVTPLVALVAVTWLALGMAGETLAARADAGAAYGGLVVVSCIHAECAPSDLQPRHCLGAAGVHCGALLSSMEALPVWQPASSAGNLRPAHDRWAAYGLTTIDTPPPRH